MSNADKRTVATDALETLGTIIGDGEKRDAIHLAVEPVVAGEPLEPGDDVGFLSPGVAGKAAREKVGIVDPFLKTRVFAGQRFWLVVYPRQVTSLRHVWTHPAFPDEPAAESATPAATEEQRRASEAWLRDFADTHGPDYDALVAAASGQHHLNDGEESASRRDGDYLHFYGWSACGEIPAELWGHVEVVTGKRIPMEQRARWLSCSC